MNPIYKFELSADSQTRRAAPVYRDDLAIEYALEQGQEFYRGKLSGKLTFQGADYQFIRQKAFDTQFTVTIYISYDRGATWAQYWQGQFWKTDCEINEDDHTAIVTPTVKDRYNDILAGMEKEYDLIQLAPRIEHIQFDKRPCYQIYIPGQTVIGCFLSGMWWEQECEAVNETDMVEIEGQNYPALTYKYHFKLNKSQTLIEISGTISPELPSSVMAAQSHYFDFVVGEYRYRRYNTGTTDAINIYKNDTTTLLWYKTGIPTGLRGRYSVTLSPVPNSGATGNPVLDIETVNVYARLITDVEYEPTEQLTTYVIPEDDLVENNRNYTRVIGLDTSTQIQFSDNLISTPTRWGIYQPGQYYAPPVYYIDYLPICRAAWGRMSVWYNFTLWDGDYEARWRKSAVLRDAYPLSSVLSVLLNKVAPGITYVENTAHSRFLFPYTSNPITEINQKIFITPKSNVISAGYDQPAQKAPITLKRVLDMLRDCFRCFWFIDDSNRLRIEHICWFMRGGTYDAGQPNVGIDLTKQIVTRNGKPWSYMRKQYQFDKPEMAARYQFGWMDDVTELFDGYPIDIQSKYVNPENIEQIDVSQFTSDIDYILLNPGEISKDGFVLLAAALNNRLPYVTFTINGTAHILQNGYLAFHYLQRYYAFDMPARRYEINGVSYVAYGIKKLKTQTLKFPVLTEPNLTNLIKTGLGNGVIQKMSVNLSARNANTTLKYDTE